MKLTALLLALTVTSTSPYRLTAERYPPGAVPFSGGAWAPDEVWADIATREMLNREFRAVSHTLLSTVTASRDEFRSALDTCLELTDEVVMERDALVAAQAARQDSPLVPWWNWMIIGAAGAAVLGVAILK
jgi:hypothetical protein